MIQIIKKKVNHHLNTSMSGRSCIKTWCSTLITAVCENTYLPKTILAIFCHNVWVFHFGSILQEMISSPFLVAFAGYITWVARWHLDVSSSLLPAHQAILGKGCPENFFPPSNYPDCGVTVMSGLTRKLSSHHQRNDSTNEFWLLGGWWPSVSHASGSHRRFSGWNPRNLNM